MSRSPDLAIIQSCLDESLSIQARLDFQETLTTIRQYANTTTPFANFSIGSFSLAVQSPEADRNAEALLTAHHALMSDPKLATSIDGLLSLNQKIRKLDSNSLRTTALNDDYPFPQPESIAEGLDILFQFLNSPQIDLFLRRIAFTQGMLSLHPFSDGNHRTFRLLLEYWLWEMGMPSMTLIKGSDFLIANPVDQKVFSLEDAVQKVLYAIGETILCSSKPGR